MMGYSRILSHSFFLDSGKAVANMLLVGEPSALRPPNTLKSHTCSPKDKLFLVIHSLKTMFKG